MPTEIIQLLAFDGPNLYGPRPGVLLRACSDRDRSARIKSALKDGAQTAGMVLAYLDVWSEPADGGHIIIANFSTPTPTIGAELARYVVDGLNAKEARDEEWDAEGPLWDLQKRRRAEALPLPDGDVDAVVAGQAAHWFDPAPAALELRRVLRPGGVVGLVWNARDERVPWVAALGEILADEARGHEADQTVVERFVRELAATEQCLESGIVQAVTPEQVVAGIATRSYAATMDADTRERFLDRVRDLLATHPDTRGRARLDLPYVTAAHRLVPA